MDEDVGTGLQLHKRLFLDSGIHHCLTCVKQHTLSLYFNYFICKKASIVLDMENTDDFFLAIYEKFVIARPSLLTKLRSILIQI